MVEPVDHGEPHVFAHTGSAPHHCYIPVYSTLFTAHKVVVIVSNSIVIYCDCLAVTTAMHLQQWWTSMIALKMHQTPSAGLAATASA